MEKIIMDYENYEQDEELESIFINNFSDLTEEDIPRLSRPIINAADFDDKFNEKVEEWKQKVSSGETDKDLAYEIARDFIEINDELFARIPDEFQTKELCLEVLNYRSEAFVHLSENLKKSEQFIIEAMEYPAIPNSLIEFMDEKYKTPNICRAAIKMSVADLEFVPGKYRNEDLYFKAIEYDPENALKYIPKEYHAVICDKAVKKDGSVLEYVPEKLRTKELYLEAIKTDGTMLSLLPKKLKTPENCFTAIKSNGEALQFVPDKIKSKIMCRTAVEQSGYAIRFIPKKFQTEEIYLAAVKKNGDALYAVPKEFKTEKVCQAALAQTKEAFEYIPEELRNNQEKALPKEKEKAIPEIKKETPLQKLKQTLRRERKPARLER
jgi:archaellum component FlaC